MSFHVKIEPFGGDAIELEPESTKKVTFRTDIPLDSNARTKDVGVTVILVGKIMSNAADTGTAADKTKSLAEWSAQGDFLQSSYRKLTIEVHASGMVTRKYELSDVFVVDYFENFDNQQGAGEYTLVLNQRKNKLKDVKVTGGFDIG